MRTALATITWMFVAAVALAQPSTFAPKKGQFTVRFPGAPKENTQSTQTALGELDVYTATMATTQGNVYLVSYTDFPPGTIKPEGVSTLYDGVRDGLKKDGKMTEKDLTLGKEKLPGREILIDKGKQQLRFRVVARGNRLYQVAVVGDDEFVNGKDATAFLESFELSK